jgi:transcriptional regulator with XRE-family HTH domain
MDVAGALRAARRAADLSQKGVARRAGLSAGALSRYESGRALPSLPALDRILAACDKDVRLLVVDRVEDLDVELARLAALSRKRRAEEGGFMRACFLERLVRHDVPVLVAGSWAAGIHGIPAEPADGQLLVPDDGDVLRRLAEAFMRGSVPFRELDGHFGSLSVRPKTFVDHPVARWTDSDIGRFTTHVLPLSGPWPAELRLNTPEGPLRVLAPEALTEQDGVQPDVLAAWRAMRARLGPDTAGWREVT